MRIIDWLTSKKRPPKTANEPENMDKPEIVVLLCPHPSNVKCLMLCIENIGTDTAYNVQFGIGASGAAPFVTPASNIGDLKSLKNNHFLRKGIGCFGPGQRIEQLLINLTDRLPKELKHPFQISVTYTDSLNHLYENKFALDFINFESLLPIDSEIEKLTSELRSLINVIQAHFSQDKDNIGTSRLPQTSKNIISKTPIKEMAEHDQPVQSEQDKPLPPEIQEFVDLYNAGNYAKLQQSYSPFHSIRVSNETERLQIPSVAPIFQTVKDGTLVAYSIDSEDLYVVAPFSGCILQDKLYSSGAFGEVFECPGFDPEYKYQVKVIRPALFKQDNEKWTLEDKGKLELEEKDQ